MFSVNRLSVHFTGEFIFDEISFLITEKDRIGLTGKNGAGKTTLMRIMAGEMPPTSGEIVLPKEKTIGYLPQEKLITSTETILDEAMKAFDEIIKMEEEINRLNEEISTRTDYESESYFQLLDQLKELNDRYMMVGGETREAEAERVLMGLGFERSDLNRSLSEFSGGWQMRVELAKILLKKPDLLLLDEPTNHLDIESIQWLEDFLIEYPGAILLVSHDRRFLDSVTKRTIEISLGKIYDYPVSYSEYVNQRAIRKEQQKAARDNQQKAIAETEKFVERFRYKATKARQVQSRIKMLEKMEKIEVDEEDQSSVHFQFPPAPRSGKVVLTAEKLEKSYGENTVFSNVNFGIQKGEFLAFVGRNGEGKSTMAKIIAEGLDHKGKMEIGHNVKIGYFAQNQAERLNHELTVFETLEEVSGSQTHGKLRAILGSFLFSGDDVEKKVKVLSGGEKTRLSLAKLLLEPVNLLILDEPTNHLDMTSKDILKNALLRFDGTLIVVSHDRDFLQGLTDKVLEFRHGDVHQHIGDVNQFLEKRRMQSFQQLETQNQQARKQQKAKSAKNTGKQYYEKKKELDRKKRKLEKEVSEAEKKIERLENEIQEMDNIMNDPARLEELTDQQDYFQKYQYKQAQLEKVMENWEKSQNDLETFKSENNIE
ncbi:MAG: ATP-binding cassette domain-containing protein [Bacteroidales bacterium]|nr:ATP-binding cassette domain-containing protein [Bacteroidales bacterium]MCF8328227.1 ATP-binding cassette domain-containing protein [Bacteroidales bacterium]